MEVIYTIHLFYILIDHVSIGKHALMYLSNAIVIIIRFVDDPIAWYYHWNEFKMLNDVIDGTIGNAKTYSINDWMYFVFAVAYHIIYVTIHFSNLHMDYFMELYKLYIDSHDFHIPSTFKSIIKKFNGLSRMFINCILIEFNTGKYNSYYLSLIQSIMIYLLIISLQ